MTHLSMGGALGAVVITAANSLLTACSGAPQSALEGQEPSADVVDLVPGVADLGADPPVVSVDAQGAFLGAGALVARDVVLTARHSVSLLEGGLSCGMPNPETPPLLPAGVLRVRCDGGNAQASHRIRVNAIIVPPGPDVCDADVALLRLDEPIDTVQPLRVRRSGVAQGEHVRTVGFARSAENGDALFEIVRDHVPVLETDARQMWLREAPCLWGCGGPVIDEAGQIAGVLSRSRTVGDGGKREGDLATRLDPFLSLIEHVLSEGIPGRVPAQASKTKRGAVDLGANCSRGADCAAGVCVTLGAARYCSRTCSTHDRCPSRFRCERSAQGRAVCVQT